MHELFLWNITSNLCDSIISHFRVTNLYSSVFVRFQSQTLHNLHNQTILDVRLCNKLATFSNTLSWIAHLCRPHTQDIIVNECVVSWDCWFGTKNYCVLQMCTVHVYKRMQYRWWILACAHTLRFHFMTKVYQYPACMRTCRRNLMLILEFDAILCFMLWRIHLYIKRKYMKHSNIFCYNCSYWNVIKFHFLSIDRPKLEQIIAIN